MQLLKIYLLLFFLFVGSVLMAQKEGLNWYFGHKAGIHFHQGYPKFLSGGALSTVEGCATISDAEGNLLMYTDGQKIYDRNHNIMPNGDMLAGSSDATQSGILVNIPDNPNLYYVFTTPTLGIFSTHKEFKVYTVDLTKNGGLGSVIEEEGILVNDNSTERVTAVQHHNEYGVWVIVHEWESNRFVAYLVSSAGIDLENPVISDVGLCHEPDSTSNWRQGIGYMKLSPDGRKLAVAISGLNIVEVFDFNDSMGVISNPVSLPFTDQPYGVEFSSHAEFLYVSERDGMNIYQWDMMAGNPQSIIDSRLLVATFSTLHGGALQMASDGKIYIARLSQDHLSVIENPGIAGIDCDFKEIGFMLPGNLCKEGLPTFIQSYFNNIWIINKENCITEEFVFYVNNLTNIDSIFWDFGEIQSTNDTAWGDTVSHVFSVPGYYVVTALCYHLSNFSEIKYDVQVKALPYVELGGDIIICQGETHTFSAGNQYLTCRWNDDPLQNLSFLHVSKEQKIFVDVFNSCGMDTDTVHLFVQELPLVNLGPDISIEYLETFLIDAGNDYNTYVWQNGSTATQYLVNWPGAFWVDVRDELGCLASDTLLVEPIVFEISVPTAFSPNGDGTNDDLMIYTNYKVEGLELEIQIFNRYGETVFVGNNINANWDGTFQGVNCPMEVYTWYFKAGVDEQNVFFKGSWFQSGNVTLLR